MTNAKPSAAILRTAAAALVVAAAVASCSSSRAADAEPVAVLSTSTTQGEPAANLSATAAPTQPAVETEASMLAAQTSTITAETPMLDTAPLVTAESFGPATSVTDTAPSRIYTPWADHLGYDAVNNARMQAPNPAVIRIPRLDVEASIIPLGLQEDGSIEVPEDPDQAGWWLGGPEPGETGPAVILGHVDSQEEGPAVFFHLRYLEAGDEIHIDRVDGSTITYVVDSTERHDKDEFPTDAVYGPTEDPTLRLVTCGGDFDFNVRTYDDNVIVFASLA